MNVSCLPGSGVGIKLRDDDTYKLVVQHVENIHHAPKRKKHNWNRKNSRKKNKGEVTEEDKNQSNKLGVAYRHHYVYCELTKT